MTLALSVISLVSLATTGALLIYVARLLRDERDRSEARTAALSVAIWRDDATDATPLERAQPPDETRTAIEDQSPGTTRALFAEADSEERVGRPRRWLAPVLGVGIVTCLIAAGTLASMKSNDRSEAAAVADERPADAPPLHLLSLRHQREGDTLIVSGLVRNPGGAPAHEHTDAVVFTFDRSGGFVATVRAALADPSLAGGSESPFSVNIPNGSDVGRYRISFRTGDRTLPHVDRRQVAESNGASSHTREGRERSAGGAP
jgi:hypothetical protein